jgi:hypothetical protein
MRPEHVGARFTSGSLCARAGMTKLKREEMSLAGYLDSMPVVDVCKE